MTATSAQKAWATRRARAASAPLPVTGFADPGSIANLADADLLALFSTVGAAVSKRFLIGRQCLTSWQMVLDYLRSTMAFRQTEQFRVLFLDKRNGLIADEVMGTGTIDHVPVYPREVARRALEVNSTAVILVHNHPSGGLVPSSADVQMTNQIKDALGVFGICVHDHVIVSREGHVSFRDLKLL